AATGSVPCSSAGGAQGLLPPPGGRAASARREGGAARGRVPAEPGQRCGGRGAAPPGRAPSPSRAAKYSPGRRRGQRRLPGLESGPGPLCRCQNPRGTGREGQDPQTRSPPPAPTGRPLPRGEPRRATSSSPRCPAGASTPGSCPRPFAATVPHRRGHPLHPQPPLLPPRCVSGGTQAPRDRWLQRGHTHTHTRRGSSGGGTRSGAGRAVQGHSGEGGGVSRLLCRARCSGGLRRPPAAVPSAPPALTMLRLGVRALPATRCGGAQRGAAAAAIPSAAPLIGGRGLVPSRPLIWVHLHAGREYPPWRQGESVCVPPGCGETLRCGGRSCPPSSAGRKRWASSQAAGRRSGLQTTGVTGGAQPPGWGLEQVQQSLHCSATRSPGI
ncbi:collagen alpha-1(I) chain-like, partial [Falco peregrinus]|uniref:collagen alpha-1(I) chain-like n=1 Tax=Falco peregrinus TaxID=8954 RepID=UPI00247A62EB